MEMRRSRSKPRKLQDHALWDQVHPNFRQDSANEWITSAKSIGWRCGYGHTWIAMIRSRYQNKTGCPYCSGQRTDPERSLATTHPILAQQLDSIASGVTAGELMPSSKRQVWWICEKVPEHRWKQFVGARTRKSNPSGCPFCRGYYASKGRNLEELFPRIAEELDLERTDIRAIDIPPKSGKKLPWRCRTNPSHRWITTVASRTSYGRGCPYCNTGGGSQRVQPEDSLLHKRPDIASQWHPDNSKHPSEVTSSSGFLAMWQCPVNSEHVWKAKVYSRIRLQSTRSGGCPICASRTLTILNSLRSLNPEIANQWHPTLNGAMTPDDVVPGARRKAWWQCDIDEIHVWEAAIFKRTSGGECPFCIPSRISRQQIRLALECRAVLGIDPDDHKIKPDDGRVMDCDIIDRRRNLVIEFDGAHWHSDPMARKRDQSKTERLERAGWRVIRIREQPLKCHRTLDISAKKNEGVRNIMLKLLDVIVRDIEPLENQDEYIKSTRLWSRGEFKPYYSALLKKQAEKRHKAK